VPDTALRGTGDRGWRERAERRLRPARRGAAVRRGSRQPRSDPGPGPLAPDRALSRPARRAGRRRLPRDREPSASGRRGRARRARDRVCSVARGRLRGRAAGRPAGAARRPVRRRHLPPRRRVASACPLGPPAGRQSCSGRAELREGETVRCAARCSSRNRSRGTFSPARITPGTVTTTGSRRSTSDSSWAASATRLRLLSRQRTRGPRR
jgi:hypothetical protein